MGIIYVYDHITADFITWLFECEVQDSEILRHTGSLVPYEGKIYTRRNKGSNFLKQTPGNNKTIRVVDYDCSEDRYPDLISFATEYAISEKHVSKRIRHYGGDFPRLRKMVTAYD